MNCEPLKPHTCRKDVRLPRQMQRAVCSLNITFITDCCFLYYRHTIETSSLHPYLSDRWQLKQRPRERRAHISSRRRASDRRLADYERPPRSSPTRRPHSSCGTCRRSAHWRQIAPQLSSFHCLSSCSALSSNEVQT